MNISYEDAYTRTLEKAKSLRITTFFSQFDEFSQWHPSVFSEGEVTYISAEQRMMHKKSELFNCDSVSKKILDISNCSIAQDFISGTVSARDLLSNKSPEKYLKCPVLLKHIPNITAKSTPTMSKLWSQIQFKIKSYGRDVSGYVESVWIENREQIVFDTSFLKYSQNKNLKFKLMSTLGTLLVEAAKNDKIWGVGMDSKNPRISNPKNWYGLNLLGKALTNLRYYFHIEGKNGQV